MFAERVSLIHIDETKEHATKVVHVSRCQHKKRSRFDHGYVVEPRCRYHDNAIHSHREWDCMDGHSWLRRAVWICDAFGRPRCTPGTFYCLPWALLL